jgi:hypothetical protein
MANKACDQCPIYAEKKWKLCAKCGREVTTVIDAENLLVDSIIKLSLQPWSDGLTSHSCTNGTCCKYEAPFWFFNTPIQEYTPNLFAKNEHDKPFWSIIKDKLDEMFEMECMFISLMDSSSFTRCVSSDKIANKIAKKISSISMKLIATIIHFGGKTKDGAKQSYCLLFLTEKDFENHFECFRQTNWLDDRFLCHPNGVTVRDVNIGKLYSFEKIYFYYREFVNNYEINKKLNDVSSLLTTKANIN